MTKEPTRRQYLQAMRQALAERRAVHIGCGGTVTDGHCQGCGRRANYVVAPSDGGGALTRRDFNPDAQHPIVTIERGNIRVSLLRDARLLVTTAAGQQQLFEREDVQTLARVLARVYLKEVQ